jgi:hypothetical protein
VSLRRLPIGPSGSSSRIASTLWTPALPRTLRTRASPRTSGPRLASARLCAETVEGPALSLERVNDIERGDGLPLGVLSVGDRVADDVLELSECQQEFGSPPPRNIAGTHEDLEDTSGLLVDESGDTLDTTSSRQTADSGLGDTPGESVSEGNILVRYIRAVHHLLDVVSQHLPVALRTALAETLAALSSSGHDV